MNRDLDILEFLIDSINHLESYIENVDEESFLRNEEKKDACLSRIVVLGEYSARVSDEIKNKFSDIEWQLMKATRNYFVHVYRGIDWRRVWETLQTDIPKLKIKIEKIINEIS
ncbi:MAG: HepT-like ribonuclease domain-containing protein [Ginsengibacter sp.]